MQQRRRRRRIRRREPLEGERGVVEIERDRQRTRFGRASRAAKPLVQRERPRAPARVAPRAVVVAADRPVAHRAGEPREQLEIGQLRQLAEVRLGGPRQRGDDLVAASGDRRLVARDRLEQMPRPRRGVVEQVDVRVEVAAGRRDTAGGPAPRPPTRRTPDAATSAALDLRRCGRLRHAIAAVPISTASTGIARSRRARAPTSV